MLTLNELRRLVKKHNQLMDIIIPPKTNRDALIKLIEKNGFTVDHDKKKIVPKVQMKRKPTVPLPPAPPKKTEEEKKVAKAKKVERDAKRDKIGYEKELQKRVEAVKKARASKPAVKKENEVRPKQSVGRPRVDPKKIKVLPKKSVPGVGKMKIKIKGRVKESPYAPPKKGEGLGDKDTTGTKGNKVWTGEGVLPNGKTTKNNVLFERDWRKEGYTVTQKAPKNFITFTLSSPETIPGKKTQYRLDLNRSQGKFTKSMLVARLKQRGFMLTGDMERALDKLEKAGSPAQVNVTIPMRGGTKVGKFKTLQPPFKIGLAKIIEGKKVLIDSPLMVIKK